MLLTAIISASKTDFCATLSDGRIVEVSDLCDLASALICLGVQAQAVKFEWCAGQRMMTAGQQVALAAEMRYLARESTEASVTA